MTPNPFAKKYFFISLVITSLAYLQFSNALSTTMMETLCLDSSSHYINFGYNLHSGILKTGAHRSWSTEVDCNVIFVPQKGSSVVLSFHSYDVRNGDQLTLTDHENHKIALHGTGKFQDERKSYVSDGRMSLHYKTNQTSHHVTGGSFQLTFTELEGGPCHSYQFQCHNEKCIDGGLACDGHNHCGDNSDQKNCHPHFTKNDKLIAPHSSSMSIAFSVFISIGALATLIVIIVFAVYVAKNRRKQLEQKKKAKTEADAPSSSQSPAIFMSDSSGGSSSPSVHPSLNAGHRQPPTAPGYEEAGHENEGFSKY